MTKLKKPINKGDLHNPLYKSVELRGIHRQSAEQMSEYQVLCCPGPLKTYPEYSQNQIYRL